MKNKVSFIPRWSKEDGTHYNQGIAISEREYETLCDILRAEKVLPKITKDYSHESIMYLHNPLERVGNIVFMNLTQIHFFSNWLAKNLSRKLLDRNTYFIIK